ncbi:hypothetical protein KBZ18_12210 [Synechococcus sp. Cruz-9H2]|uniref:hypothetical protein n=1 Tax=unclassified Synechococcus TaxID=2626047 RepID=UPI0020CE57F3|nr:MULTISPECIES: hypothetical protein [unclassified Synechococcus]MCP9820247.1 hypothetical protein [Synechococcus sp. Cruz-9H2]MCP9844512.1 hypothetical protein [Synechococcus sp. Edmonson 11F2]MCP9856677.1 hypothetical protein [Synechococcus sp. Cruz-9C9]MCP9863963.1 hypothetical protein [Synechococcus sp. Cruz-7E5]MCP9871116.1 hypothetical protein [Synechococcus sp. Cruz-7B9]
MTPPSAVLTYAAFVHGYSRSGAAVIVPCGRRQRCGTCSASCGGPIRWHSVRRCHLGLHLRSRLSWPEPDDFC